MKRKRSGAEGGLWTVGIGFGLTILLMLGAAYASILSLGQGHSRMLALAQEQRITDRLIAEVQGEEAGLSSLFYALARSGKKADRSELLRQLAVVNQDIERTFAAVKARPDAERWRPVQAAVDRFTSELRSELAGAGSGGGARSGEGLFRSHEALTRELSSLVSANYERAVETQAREDDVRRTRLRFTIGLLAVAVLLSVASAVATVRKANSVLRRTAWQARELSRLSGHVLETQETVIRRLSRELHDEFGQTLSAIEANLAAIPVSNEDQQSRIEDCVLLIQDAMSNVRELSQLLRPSILDDFGLNAALQWLADSFQQRTGIEVEARIAHEGRLPGETETHLFRIAQEALTNVARHSGAKRVELSLSAEGGRLRLTIADNGHGLTPRAGRTGFGMMGMRERMRAAGGELHVHSRPGGLSVVAEVPVE
jgi:signal transduction histidine kinase